MASKPTLSFTQVFCPDSGHTGTGILGCGTTNSPPRTPEFPRPSGGPRSSATSSSATNPFSTVISQTTPPTSTSSTLSDTTNPTAESESSSNSVLTSSPSYLNTSSTPAPLSPTITSLSSFLGSNETNSYTVISLPSTPAPFLSAPTTTQSTSIPNVQDMTGAAVPGSSTSSLQTSASPGQSNSVASGASHTSSSTHSDHTGAIVGAIIGGLAFLLLTTVATILLRRRMRARHTAPSAEFMGLARGPTPGPGGLGIVRTAGTTTPSGHRLLSPARQNTLGDDDDDRPPAFTPGVYADPVMEKVQVAAAMREQYRPRDSYCGGARADYKEGMSEIGHEGESTQVGTEEGYGSVGDEKSGYYTWAM